MLNQGSVPSTSKQSSILLKKSCLAILSILASLLPSVHSLRNAEHLQTSLNQTEYTPDLHLHPLRNTMLTQHDRITRSLLADPPASSKADDGPTFLEAFFGYFLIVIGGLSLVGWGYVYYLRRKYSQKANKEEGQVKAAKKCCQGSGLGVSPIALNTPPQSRNGSHVEEEDEMYDLESVHAQPQEQHRHNQQPQHLTPRVRNRQQNHQHQQTSMMSNSTYEPSIDESDEEDSFARELKIAARTDQHSWAHEVGNQRALALKLKRVPSLKPPKKDVEHIENSFGIFDSFFGWNKNDGHSEVRNTANVDHEQGFMQSPKVSYLPEQLQPPAETNSFSRGSFNPRGGRSQHQQHQSHIPMNASDPSDVMLSDSSGTSSSYAGKNSSVEEEDYEEDGFELVGYLKKRNDGMNKYLLNPIQTGDDASFGDASGMGMSLGATTAVTNQTTSTHGKGSEGRGFYVIDEQNDLMHEYIPKDEYDAAVMAAAYTLKNSPRNSPRNSPLRGRSEADIHNTWLNEKGELHRVPSSPSDEHDSRYPPLMTSTHESSEGYSVSVDESISMDRTRDLDSSTGESEPALSKDIYNELKNVSAFIRNYEKNKSKGDSSRLWSSGSNEIVDSSDDTNTFYSNESQPSITLKSTSEAESTSKEKKRNKFRKPTFGRKKKGYALQDEVSDFEVKVKSKQKSKKNSKLRMLPPRHRTHKEMEDSDQEDSGQQDYDDDVIIMQNPNRPNDSRRRQLPVAGNGTYPGIGMSPSGESAASDAKFLRNEIESFFSQQDTSMSVMSESIEVLHRPNGEKAKPKKMHKSPQTQAVKNDDVHETSFETEFSGSASPTSAEFNRLGAMPFNPKDSAASPFDRKMPSPPSSVRVKSPGRSKKLKSPAPLVSSRKDTIPVYGESVYSPPSQFKPQKQVDQVPLAQSARSILQTGAKSIASIIDKARQSPKEISGSLQSKEDEAQANEGVQRERIRNTVSGLETKLQTGARSFMSMFEGKGSDEAVVSDPSAPPSKLATRNSRSSYDHNMTDRISNRLEQIRRNVKERAAANSSPGFSPRNRHERSAHDKKSQETNTRQSMDIFDEDEERPRASRKVQVATFVSPAESMISPSAAHQARRERRPGRILKTNLDVSQQSGDATTESPSRVSIESRSLASPRRDVPAAVEAISKRNLSSANSIAGSASSARNLISMFESRHSNVSGIFPSGEHWQHGNLKGQRKFAPSPR